MTRVLSTRALVAVALLGASLGLSIPAAEAGGPSPALSVPASIEAGTIGSARIINFTSEFACFNVDIDITIQPDGGSPTPWLTIPWTTVVDGRATVEFTAPGSPGDYTVVATDGSCTALAFMEVYPSTTTSPPTTAAPTTAAPTTGVPTTAPPTTGAPTAIPPTTVVPTTPVLPATGRASGSLVWPTFVVLLLGGGMLAVATRRR